MHCHGIVGVLTTTTLNVNAIKCVWITEGVYITVITSLIVSVWVVIMNVIARPDLNVKMVLMGGGIVGPNALTAPVGVK